MRLPAIFLFLAAALMSPDAAARKPKNPRRAKAKAAAEARAAKEKAPEPPRFAGLPAARWSPDVRKAIDDFVLANGKWGASYDPKQPPVAALAFNDAVMRNDAGEALFARVVAHAGFKFDDDWWTLIPLTYGRQRLRAAYERFQTEPVSVWTQNVGYQQYRKGFHRSYHDMCSKVSRKECRAWMSTLFAGFGRDEVDELAREVIKEGLGKPLGHEELIDKPGDPVPFALREGLAFVPEMESLVRLLLDNGFDLWIVENDYGPALEAAAREIGIDASRVLGISLEESTTTFKALGVAKEPIPFRGGKVAALVSAVGRPAALVVGASAADVELMSYGPGLRVLLDGGDESARATAEEREWLVQPAFAP